MATQLKKSTPLYFYPFIALSLVIVTAVPPIFVLGWGYWHITYWVDSTSISMLMNGIGLYISSMVFNRFERFPQRNPVAFLLPIVFSVYGILLSMIMLSREPYSIRIMLLGLLATIVLLAIQHVLSGQSRKLNLYCLPLGDAASFTSTPHYTFKLLLRPKLPRTYFDGVVADMRFHLMPQEWQKFLADCAFKGVPIYNAMQLNETITGRVNAKNLIENNFGLLSPSLFRQNLKRFFDLMFLLFISPIAIPLMLMIALLIKRDSPGGIFFVQRRMGLNGRWFKVLKFRTMYADPSKHIPLVDGVNPNITNIGRILRKYRLDELPQFWNVLKGEMSLIGPRPESEELARWYSKEVMFFSYRHVVRPGISGWAQVMQGYTQGLDEMDHKLEYDFYYIKHFSVWLDLLIWYKTIRTVLTGFGSR